MRALGQATTGVAPTKNHDETEPPPGIRSNHDGREALGAGFKPAPKSYPSCPSCLRGERFSLVLRSNILHDQL